MLQWLLAADGGILLWLQETVRCTVLDGVLCAYTHLGDVGLLWIALSAAMLCFRPTRRAGGLALCAMLLGMLCTNVVLKHVVGRARPWLTVEGLIPLVAEGDPNSFPSGHSCAAFAAAGVWVRTLPRRWMGAAGLVAAGLMAFSRLYVGVHFPSDVLVGVCVGLMCSLLVLLGWKRLADRLGWEG